MRKLSPTPLLILATLAAAGLACQVVTGLSPTLTEPASTEPAPPPTSPPMPTVTPLPPPTEPAPGDLTGSRWFIYYAEPSGDYYEYELVFHPGGRLENSHPNETTPDNDTWMQSGDTVVLFFNDSYATYEGQISGDAISGMAVNVTGGLWAWNAYRLP